MLKMPILILLIWLSAFSHSEIMNNGGLMIGYTDSMLLPFLDQSSLEFQLGEELWVMAIGGEIEVILRDPSGLEQIYRLRADEPRILKRFAEESDIGDWSLETAGGGTMRLIVSYPENEPLIIRYGIDGSNVVVRLDGSPNAVFADNEGSRRLLLIAGDLNELNLSDFLEGAENGKFSGEIIVEVLSEDRVIYRGFINDLVYTVELEPLIVKTIAAVKNGKFNIYFPIIHEVGPGGVLPLRPGRAILRLSLNDTSSITRPIYVLDQRFERFKGAIVDRATSIPLVHALNNSIKILNAFEEKMEIIDLTIPISRVRILDSHGNPLTNASIAAENPVKVVNGSAYILLRTSESVPAPVKRSLRTSIKVDVNGFNAGIYEMEFVNGETYNLTPSLNRITIKVVSPEKMLPKELILTINGTTFKHEDGVCSYLLPPGEYFIKAEAPGLEGATMITLSQDVLVELKLKKVVKLEDLLKLSAATELAVLVLLIYVDYRATRRPNKKIKRKYRLHVLRGAPAWTNEKY